MVNNSTIINKVNNHLSPSLTEHKKNTTAYDVGNPGPGLRQAQKYGRVLIYFATTFCRVKVQEKGQGNVIVIMVTRETYVMNVKMDFLKKVKMIHTQSVQV